MFIDQIPKQALSRIKNVIQIVVLVLLQHKPNINMIIFNELGCLTRT